MTQEKLNEQLFKACDNKHWEKVKKLINNGADVNVTSTLNWTALHFAVYNNNLDIVKYLIENGADVNAKNIADKTPSDFAKYYDCQEIAQYLEGLQQ